jgi:membrane protease subunit HflK
MPWSNQSGGGGGGADPGASAEEAAAVALGAAARWRRQRWRFPPDLEEILRRSQDRLKNLLPGGNLGGRGLILGLLVLV